MIGQYQTPTIQQAREQGTESDHALQTFEVKVNNTSFRIASQNVNAPNEGITYKDGAGKQIAPPKNTPLRIKKAIERAASDGADVIALQEIGIKRNLWSLRKYLKSVGYEVAYSQPYGRDNKDGRAILVKKGLSWDNSTDYVDQLDKNRKKGCQKLTVCKSGVSLDVVNAHLSNHPQSVTNMGNRLANRSPKNPLVIVGDFNLPPQTVTQALQQSELKAELADTPLYNPQNRQSTVTIADKSGHYHARHYDHCVINSQVEKGDPNSYQKQPASEQTLTINADKFNDLIKRYRTRYKMDSQHVPGVLVTTKNKQSTIYFVGANAPELKQQFQSLYQTMTSSSYQKLGQNLQNGNQTGFYLINDDINDDKITAQSFKKQLGNKAKSTLFIFPGNDSHHQPQHTLDQCPITGDGLAKPAAEIQNDSECGPALSLPVTNVRDNVAENGTDYVKSALRDIWTAIGQGFLVALPVRQHINKQYFQDKLCKDKKGRSMEPKFWGGVETEPNPKLAEFYLNELKKIQRYFEHYKLPNDLAEDLKDAFNWGQNNPSTDFKRSALGTQPTHKPGSGGSGNGHNPGMTVGSGGSSKSGLSQAAEYLQKNGYEVETIKEDQTYKVKTTNSNTYGQFYALQSDDDQYQVTTTIKPNQVQDYYQSLAKDAIDIAVTCVRSDDSTLDNENVTLDIELGNNTDERLLEALADEIANNGYELNTNNSALEQAVQNKTAEPGPSSSAPKPTGTK